MVLKRQLAQLGSDMTAPSSPNVFAEQFTGGTLARQKLASNLGNAERQSTVDKLAFIGQESLSAVDGDRMTDGGKFSDNVVVAPWLRHEANHTAHVHRGGNNPLFGK
jgi:hypothetical protein